MPKAKIDYYRFQDSDERVLIAYCDKGTFVKLASSNCVQCTPANWIKDRMSVTRNQSELELMKFNEGMMIVVEKGFPIEFIPLKEEETIEPTTKTLTRKQFNELSKQYEALYIADEKRGNTYWEVWGFAEIEGEYHKLVKKEKNNETN
jgi:hypothetical protein